MEPSLEKIFRVSRAFGVFPFDQKFRLTKKTISYCACLHVLAAFGSVSLFCYEFNRSERTSWPEPHQAFFVLFHIHMGIFVFTRAFNFFWLVEKREDVFELLDGISRMLHESNQNAVKYCFAYFTYAVCILQFGLSFFKQLNKMSIIITSWFHFVQFCCVSSMVCLIGDFCDLLLLLGRLLREAIERGEELAIKKIERLSSLAELLDEVYGPIILLSVTNCFGGSLINLFVLMTRLFIDDLVTMVIVSGWLGISIISLLSIICSSGIFIKQVRLILEAFKGSHFVFTKH